MTEVVERVARALHAAFTPYADYSYSWDDPMASREMFYALARAAILALRDADQAMIDEGGNLIAEERNYLDAFDLAEKSFTTMIDVALAE